MVKNRLRGDGHRCQISAPSPSVRARYQNLNRDTASRGKGQNAERIQPVNPTTQAENTHPSDPTALIVTTTPDPAPLMTTITLTIDNRPFSIPHDPLKAFHITRAQTITSFRAIAAGTATASDKSFIFGTVHAASLDSDASKWTPNMGEVAPKNYSGSTREIKIDSHTLILPTGTVDSFLATREMTIAAYRNVIACEAAAEGGRDMAIVFGTAIIVTPERNSIVDVDGVVGPQAHKVGEETTKSSTSYVPVKVENHEGDYDGAEKCATPKSDGGRNPPSRNELTPAVAMLGEGFHRPALSDMAQDETACVLSTSTSTLTPIPTTTTPAVLMLSIPPTLTPSTAAQGNITNQRPKTFIGDFRDLDHASLKLHQPHSRIGGVYIEGFLSISGGFATARTLIGEARCGMCAFRDISHHTVGHAVCRVLAEEDPVRSALENKGVGAGCGFCLLAGTRCVVGW